MPRQNRSTRHTPYRAPDIPCQRKRRFKTDRDALEALEKASLFDMKIELKTYLCPFCNGWHLSSVKSPDGKS
jgi:hypothetical protein